MKVSRKHFLASALILILAVATPAVIVHVSHAELSIAAILGMVFGYSGGTLATLVFLAGVEW